MKKFVFLILAVFPLKLLIHFFLFTDVKYEIVRRRVRGKNVSNRRATNEFEDFKHHFENLLDFGNYHVQENYNNSLYSLIIALFIIIVFGFYFDVFNLKFTKNLKIVLKKSDRLNGELKIHPNIEKLIKLSTILFIALFLTFLHGAINYDSLENIQFYFGEIMPLFIPYYFIKIIIMIRQKSDKKNWPSHPKYFLIPIILFFFYGLVFY